MTLRHRLRARLLATALCALGASAPAATPPAASASLPATAAVVQQPRPFGYTVGDLATQRVLLVHGGRAFEPASLPGPGRANAWLERRAVRVERAADGQRWLVVEYQLVNAPRALASVPLPGWELAGAPGTPALRVAPAVLAVAPLTTPVSPGDVPPLRPDRPPPALDTAALQHRLVRWLVALTASLAAWAAYATWSRWRAGQTQPFARALRELRAAQASPTQAHRALHAAFDRTAGRVVHAQTLDTLFQRAPHLRPLRPQVERFYAQSAALFFGPGLPADALSPRSLCRQLRRLERRHA